MKELTCTNETVTSDIFTCDNRFQQEAVSGVLRNAKVSHAWSDEIGWKLDINWDTISAFFVDKEFFYRLKRRKGLQGLRIKSLEAQKENPNVIAVTWGSIIPNHTGQTRML